jgi:hypothetical protein
MLQCHTGYVQVTTPTAFFICESVITRDGVTARDGTKRQSASHPWTNVKKDKIEKKKEKGGGKKKRQVRQHGTGPTCTAARVSRSAAVGHGSSVSPLRFLASSASASSPRLADTACFFINCSTESPSVTPCAIGEHRRNVFQVPMVRVHRFPCCQLSSSPTSESGCRRPVQRPGPAYQPVRWLVVRRDGSARWSSGSGKARIGLRGHCSRAIMDARRVVI